MCCALAGRPSSRILVTKALLSLLVLTDTSLCYSFGGAAGFRCRDSIGSVGACRLEFEVLRSAVCQGSMQQPRLISTVRLHPAHDVVLQQPRGTFQSHQQHFAKYTITSNVAFNLPEHKCDRAGISGILPSGMLLVDSFGQPGMSSSPRDALALKARHHVMMTRRMLHAQLLS